MRPLNLPNLFLAPASPLSFVLGGHAVTCTLTHSACGPGAQVGLGAVASFGISCVATALPRLGWPTFFEEPAMLIGVVLLGKTLEERAKLAASSDMASLQVTGHGAHQERESMECVV